MNPAIGNENWNEKKTKLKAMYDFLTDNDLVYMEGKKEEMMEQLQLKLGKTKDDLHKLIESL